MQEIKVKIKSEDRVYSVTTGKSDSFDTSKANYEMVQLIESIIKESNLDPIDEVIVRTKSEW